MMSSNGPIIQQLSGIHAPEAFSAVRGLPNSVWLDSVVHEPRGRLSIVAADPVLVIRSKRSTVRWTGDGFDLVMRANPFDSLAEWFDRASSDAPPPSQYPPGAAIGYFGYELKNSLESLPQRASDDLRLPDMCVGIYDVLLVFDHLQNENFLISTGITPQGRRDDDRARARADFFRDRLSGAVARVAPTQPGRPPAVFSEAISNFKRHDYITAVQRAKEYIAAGDVYQVNLSQRFECRAAAPLTAGDYGDLYFRLRHANPAPFAACLDLGDAAVLSSSPECFLDIRGRTIRTYPIKGTRPRGNTPEDDKRLVAELSSSAKDRAELVMIVDLERNDIGRVCDFGSVCVPELATVESYTTVHHLVATVEGRLRPDLSHIDCLRACFPGGSITGAPKIRAMEIIDELEPHARGVYTGAIGMLGLPDASGNQHTVLNIAIRTMTVLGDRILFHSGGGIVADSDPDSEYEETIHKARGLMMALGTKPSAF